MDNRGTILIVDDDPLHLKLYSWIIGQGGYTSLTALVKRAEIVLPDSTPIDLAIMDYSFGGLISATDVAQKIIVTFPDVPILVLSDQSWMPHDIAPFASGFVRKGDPALLLQRIGELLD
jgi:DNA-binding response OmpR family regulator